MVRRLLRRAVRGNVRLLMNVVNLGESLLRLVQTATQQRADERLPTVSTNCRSKYYPLASPSL